jgi:hypothetical protein
MAIMGRGRKLTLEIVTDTRAIRNATDATATGIGKISGQISGLATAFAGIFAADQIITFLGDAGEAFREDKRQVALLNREIANLGTAAQDAGPEIDAFVSRWQAIGADDTGTRDALKRAIALTDDYETALRTANIAMDVAASLGIETADAVDLIVKAVGGKNLKAIQRLGIEQGKTNTPFETFVALESKYRGALQNSATDMDRFRIRADEAKESIGEWVDAFQIGLVGIVEWFVGAGEDAGTAMSGGFIRTASGNIMRDPALKVSAQDAAAQISEAFQKQLDDEPPPKFPRITFPKFDAVGELIDSITASLDSATVKTKLADFWTKVLSPKLKDKDPNVRMAAQAALLTVGDALGAGTFPSEWLPKGMRTAVDKAQKDAGVKADINNYLNSLFPKIMYPLITVKPKFVTEGGMKWSPTYVNPSRPGTGTGGYSVQQQAAPVVVNIQTGVGDPVAIGREVSRTLDAYTSRGGVVG